MTLLQSDISDRCDLAARLVRADYSESGRDLAGDYENSKLVRTLVPGGYLQDGAAYYYVCDHQGNVRKVLNGRGQTVQETHYYPYGMPFGESNAEALASTSGYAAQPYKYGGKEAISMCDLSFYDFAARPYDPALALFHTPDPHAENYISSSCWLYCGGDPINKIDYDGMDWYSITEEFVDDDGIKQTRSTYHYTEYTSQEELDKNGIKGTYLDKIVVVMEGSANEKLGKGKNMYSDDSVLANVTVYGPNGQDDIQNYQGFSMTSDFEKYGAIADGTYNVTYRTVGKSGKLTSHYAINDCGPVDCVDNKNPSQIDPYSNTQKDKVWIHRANLNGYAGGTVSTGCILISPKHWDDFQNQIGKNGFTFILTRTPKPHYPK